MSFAAASLAPRLDGLLFFPVTACDKSGRLAPEPFRQHILDGVNGGAAAVFACCGTGEFLALDLDEYAAAVTAAVEACAGRVPVFAGVGYGTSLAVRMTEMARQAGADGVLVLPPYLARPGQGGLLRHYERISDSTDLPLILYQRDNAVFDPPTVARLAARPNILGLKDGHGDLDLMQRIISEVRSQAGPDIMLYFNGLATAEMSALAYDGIGVSLYSSSVYCFAPRVALAFHAALRARDSVTVTRLLDDFYRPLVALRHQGDGYAVSLIKAGVRLRGLDVGPVRPPFEEPSADHVNRLAELIAIADEIAGRPDGATRLGTAGSVSR
jgi:5-dehydro-4-deoxyglucarate dehydratase